VGDDGARALADALKNKVSLKELHLSGNTVNDDGARALADTLQTNFSLTRLDLYVDDDSVFADINSRLERNKLVGPSAFSALRTARSVIMLQPTTPAVVVDTIMVHADARCGEHLTMAQRHAIIVLARVHPLQPLSRADVLRVLRPAVAAPVPSGVGGGAAGTASTDSSSDRSKRARS